MSILSSWFIPLVLAQPLAPPPEEVLDGLKKFYARTALPNGSFRPGVDPDYKGLADCAASDLAAPTYAVILHKTFGWELPEHSKTADFFLYRQKEDGAFFHKIGTHDPESGQGRLYNTTMGLVALNALGEKPRFDPLPVFEPIAQKDAKSLPLYCTSFFPLAFRTQGKKFPDHLDPLIKASMTQAEDGYLGNHVAATFHLVHYYRLVNQAVPQAEKILARTLRDQKDDGSWWLNPPARDRHATFDAAFTLKHLGGNRPEVQKALHRAAAWGLRCRNPDGGFGHYPGSPSDADANYFQVGTLVLAGYLQPARNLPDHAGLWGWGHLLPVK